MRHRSALLAAVVALACAPGAAPAAPGDLDRGFGVDGSVQIDMGGLDVADALALQADGRIVTAGRAGGDMMVARFLASGAPDPSFGGGAGRVAVDFGGTERAAGVAIQTDGKIVVVGQTSVGNAVAVARLRTDGALDATPVFQQAAYRPHGFGPIGPGVGVFISGFDDDGRKTLDLGDYETGGDVVVQPNGRILIAANDSGSGVARVVRLTASGGLDTSFDGDGLAVVGTASTGESLEALALLPDGGILAAGATISPSGSEALVARLLPGGAPDADFGEGGVVVIPGSGLYDRIHDLAREPGGRIVAAGTIGSGGESSQAAAWRLLPGGEPDPGFGTGGAVTIGLGPSTTVFGRHAHGVALQPDGKLAIAGTNDRKYDTEAHLVRLQPGGLPDTTFDDDGRKRVLAGGAFGQARDVVVQADGRLLFAGGAGAQLDTALVRVQGDDPAAAVGGSGAGGAGAGPPGPAAGGSAVPRCAGRRATIVGTARRDVLRGTSRGDVIAALGGDDVVRGLSGADVICGGGGRDLLIGGRGADRLLGQAGRDVLRGGPGRDVLSGGAARDACSGGTAPDRASACERRTGI